MGSADMKGLRFADAQESRLQAWESSYMGSAVRQGGRFDDVQELRFQATKRSDMSSDILQVGRLQNVQWCSERWLICLFVGSSFLTAKGADMNSFVLQGD